MNYQNRLWAIRTQLKKNGVLRPLDLLLKYDLWWESDENKKLMLGLKRNEQFINALEILNYRINYGLIIKTRKWKV